jgi:hypothetical protein
MQGDLYGGMHPNTAPSAGQLSITADLPIG